MPRKLLSSKLTVFYKIFFPLVFLFGAVWFLAVFAFGMGVWNGRAPVGFLMLVLIVTVINLLWTGWLALRSCTVEADDENFYVSNFGKEAVIPRSDLYEATEMRWFKPYWITLRLRRPSVFGDKVIFIPPWRIGGFWTANPMVEELNAARTRW